jgi:hypothetical protein
MTEPSSLLTTDGASQRSLAVQVRVQDTKSHTVDWGSLVGVEFGTIMVIGFLAHPCEIEMLASHGNTF